jgi:D-alanyl-D-alanine dipeptidase
VRPLLAALAALLPLSAGPAPRPDLVDVAQAVPDAVLDLRYAAADNFLHRRVYPTARCLLLRPAARRLAAAAARLRAQGYRLRLWDCYRPLSVQWQMWRILPHPGYVADPRRGSNHNRGAAVDLSLAATDGKEVEMPTPFDAFGARAHADAVEGVSPAARKNRALLRRAMEAEGFLVHPNEWWHFATRNARRLPILDVPLEAARQ